MLDPYRLMYNANMGICPIPGWKFDRHYRMIPVSRMVQDLLPLKGRSIKGCGYFDIDEETGKTFYQTDNDKTITEDDLENLSSRQLNSLLKRSEIMNDRDKEILEQFKKKYQLESLEEVEQEEQEQEEEEQEQKEEEQEQEKIEEEYPSDLNNKIQQTVKSYNLSSGEAFEMFAKDNLNDYLKEQNLIDETDSLYKDNNVNGVYDLYSKKLIGECKNMNYGEGSEYGTGKLNFNTINKRLIKYEKERQELIDIGLDDESINEQLEKPNPKLVDSAVPVQYSKFGLGGNNQGGEKPYFFKDDDGRIKIFNVEVRDGWKDFKFSMIPKNLNYNDIKWKDNNIGKEFLLFALTEDGLYKSDILNNPKINKPENFSKVGTVLKNNKTYNLLIPRENILPKQTTKYGTKTKNQFFIDYKYFEPVILDKNKISRKR
jgi:hypothetical protein